MRRQRRPIRDMQLAHLELVRVRSARAMRRAILDTAELSGKDYGAAPAPLILLFSAGRTVYRTDMPAARQRLVAPF